MSRTLAAEGMPAGPGTTAALDDRSEIVRCRDLSMAYPTRGAGGSGGSLEVFTGLEVAVKEREFVAVVGPSGCGKTTLLKMIAGLYPPTAGEVYVAGTKVTSPVTDVGIVFQRDLLLDWRTVLGNIMLQIEVRKLDVGTYRDKAHELLEMVGLTGFADAYPRQLSGGMRQRAAICRALIHSPRLLLMDEPFGAVDALTRERLNLDLQYIGAKTEQSVLFITHDIQDAVFLADRVLVMGPRPSHIDRVIDIDLGRPRPSDIRSAPAFVEYCAEIRSAFDRLGLFNSHPEGGR